MLSTPQSRASAELRQRLMHTIEEWGKTQRGMDQLAGVTVDALLKMTAMICVYRDMAASGLHAEKIQEYLRALNREAPLSADAEDAYLAWQARKEVLLQDLLRSVRPYSA
jgi:hypothetical protein